MNFDEILSPDNAKELLTVLSCIDEEFLNNIPDDIIKRITVIASESNIDYYINPNIPLEEQKISNNCKKVLAYLYNTYVTNNKKIN